MDLSIEAVSKVIGAHRVVPITEKEMAKELEVVFFPSVIKDRDILKFEKRLKSAVESLGIKVSKFEDVCSSKEFTAKRKLNDGVVILFSGVDEAGKLPMDYVRSLSNNPIVKIIKVNNLPDENIPFIRHMEYGLSLFTKYMSNIAICFDDEGWKSYTYNGFSKKYLWKENFKDCVLKSIVPKLATRVMPMKLDEFEIETVKWDFIRNADIGKYVKDLIKCGSLLAHSKLFPSVMNVDEFQYDNKFYRRIAKSFLDERTGMSYGFIARQLPVHLEEPLEYGSVKSKFNFGKKDYLISGNKIYLLIQYKSKKYVVKVPPVWVLMSRSGSNKTRLDSSRDVLLVGIENGRFKMRIPETANIDHTYKPSFDTRLILSHCLANAVYGAFLKKFSDTKFNFSTILEEEGMAIIHWHGFINRAFVPRGWDLYGQNNPPVLCSSPQSSIYAFKGKEKAVENALKNGIELLGDIQFEPQHGVNITGATLKRIAYYLFSLNSLSVQNAF